MVFKLGLADRFVFQTAIGFSLALALTAIPQKYCQYPYPHLSIQKVTMILIDDHQLMAPGDIFEMRFNDWYRIIHPPMGPIAIAGGGKKIECKVLRMFLRSSREVRYVCVSLEDQKQSEFVLGQILEDAYQVSVSHPTLKVSASVVVEAAATIGVRSISPEMPTLYTKEDAEKLPKAIQDLPVKERYGYLVAENV